MDIVTVAVRIGSVNNPNVGVFQCHANALLREGNLVRNGLGGTTYVIAQVIWIGTPGAPTTHAIVVVEP